MTMMRLSLLITAAALLLTCSNAFSPRTMASRAALMPRSTILFNGENNNNVDTDISTDESKAASTDESKAAKKLSLEEKMKGWEATEEEIKAKTLGGIVPGRSDAFDVGLYIAFPLLVISSLIFVFFPFIIEHIDTSSVGAPPTV
jgi:hypothetical protein